MFVCRVCIFEYFVCMWIVKVLTLHNNRTQKNPSTENLIFKHPNNLFLFTNSQWCCAVFIALNVIITADKNNNNNCAVSHFVILWNDYTFWGSYCTILQPSSTHCIISSETNANAHKVLNQLLCKESTLQFSRPWRAPSLHLHVTALCVSAVCTSQQGLMSWGSELQL